MTKSREYINAGSAMQQGNMFSELIASAVTGVTLGQQRVYRTIILAVFVTGISALGAGFYIGISLPNPLNTNNATARQPSFRLVSESPPTLLFDSGRGKRDRPRKQPNERSRLKREATN